MASDGKTNILVVDDLPEKLLVMESILAELGQTLITARSGGEALRRVLEHDFAVVLLDVNMPEMDGFETASLIRQRKRSQHTPIIFITAFHDEMHAAQGYSLGAVDYILAPVIPEVLRTKVRVFVELFQKNEQVRRQAEERVALAQEQAARAAAEEATRRSTFLAEASTVLVRSLDVETTLRALARTPVPFLAACCAAITFKDRQPPRNVELAWLDPATGQVEARSFPHQALPAPLKDGIARVLTSGTRQTLVAPSFSPSGMAAANSEPAEGARPPVFPPVAIETVVLLPLHARGKTLGVVALMLAPSGRVLGPADLAVAEELASRGALALDNARLYHDIQEADRRKNEFLAMLSHELRNPLAPLLNAVHVLRKLGQQTPELEWARDVIDRQVQQMARLVDDLLDVSRITRGKVKLQCTIVDVAAVVARAVEISEPLIHARQHKFNLTLPSEPVLAVADPTRLAQVLANFLNNAAKYTEEGGQIWLTVERVGDEVVFRVRDTGIGIPAEMLESIFDLFTQVDRSLDRSQGGLGVGLTLVNNLVSMHGGRVEAHSPGPNQGSEFIVRLSALTEVPAEGLPALACNGSAKPAAPYRILVVDDNVDAADTLGMLLRAQGHEVAVTHDGPTALQTMTQLRPRFVLLDIGLPNMDGYAVARQIRLNSEFAGSFLIALTGYGQEEDRLRAMDAGFDHHLVKPVDPEALPDLFARLDQSAAPS
jgi:signal transduction histidine kinase/DNA-binding response OmpR family regulator